MYVFTKFKFENALLLAFILVLTVFGASYFIHSSELWSVYISKNLFTSEYFPSVSLKPLFHFFLFLFHKLPLNDVQHLQIVKSVFAVLGSLQFIFIWKIFSKYTNCENKLLYQLVFFTFAASSTLLLQNYFRIRSDQVCATVFLFFIYLNASRRLPLKFNLFFIAIYPLIALKGILFSLLQLIHVLITYRKEVFVRKYSYLYILAVIAILLSVINFSWDGVLYFLQTTNSFAESYTSLKNWFLADFLIIALSVISLFNISYQKWSIKILNLNLSIISVCTLLIIVLFPQKHTYFIASFTPLLILNALFLVVFSINNYLPSEKLKKIATYAFLFLFSYECFNLYNASVYRSNFSQLKFIQFIAPIIAVNNFSYIDGIGALPRANNLNCFVSPNDDVSNSNCVHLVQNGNSDVVVLTSRLMSLLGSDDILKNNYKHIGFNIYVKKDFDFQFIPPKNLSPALLVFGFEN